MIKVNSQGVFMSLGGSMIKVNSPLLREILEEAIEEGLRKGRRVGTEKVLVTVLVTRFGPKASAVKAELKDVGDPRLQRLISLAVNCPDLDAFRQALRRENASEKSEGQFAFRSVAGVGTQPQRNRSLLTGMPERRQTAFQGSSMGSSRRVIRSARV